MTRTRTAPWARRLRAASGGHLDRDEPPWPFDSSEDSLAEAWRQLRLCLAGDRQVDNRLDALVTLTIWRVGQCLHGKSGLPAFLLRRLVTIVDSIWTKGIIGAELPRQVPAGPGLRLPHAGRGVIVHNTCRLGARVTLYHRTTLGIRKSPFIGPFLEDDVYVGTGASVLGSVRLGAGTKVGANAVLVQDSPPGTSWVGPTAVALPRPPGHG